MEPVSGEIEKKHIFFQYITEKGTTIMLWQGLIFRFCHSIMVVSSPQYGEHTAFFSSFPLGGIFG